MDGNGRWAKSRGKPRIYGHKKGVESVREVVRAASSLGIKALTLYAFSEENWGRPQTEVNFLISLLDYYLEKDRDELLRNNVTLRTIGRLDALPGKTQQLIAKTKAILSANTGLTLTIALSYSGQQEIMAACRQIAKEAQAGTINPDQINKQFFESYLETKGLPDLDLLIRTSGEQRLSNFLLWQCAYTEFWFSQTYFPDFKQQDFFNCILAFQQRDRRFGRLDDQVSVSSLIQFKGTDKRTQEIC